jgi:uncharacterized protein YbjT (DUF2867 family)
MLAAPDAAAPALRAKFRAEQAIAASAVPSTILRPTYFMETLAAALRCLWPTSHSCLPPRSAVHGRGPAARGLPQRQPFLDTERN